MVALIVWLICSSGLSCLVLYIVTCLFIALAVGGVVVGVDLLCLCVSVCFCLLCGGLFWCFMWVGLCAFMGCGWWVLV